MQAKPSNKTSIHIDNLIFQPQDTKIPTVKKLQNHTDTTPYGINTTTIIGVPLNPNAPTFFLQISNSTDKLFFILYTPANTLSRRWYLAQADI